MGSCGSVIAVRVEGNQYVCDEYRANKSESEEERSIGRKMEKWKGESKQKKANSGWAALLPSLAALPSSSCSSFLGQRFRLAFVRHKTKRAHIEAFSWTRGVIKMDYL